jgi:hypothetical protein
MAYAKKRAATLGPNHTTAVEWQRMNERGDLFNFLVIPAGLHVFVAQDKPGRRRALGLSEAILSPEDAISLAEFILSRYGAAKPEDGDDNQLDRFVAQQAHGRAYSVVQRGAQWIVEVRDVNAETGWSRVKAFKSREQAEKLCSELAMSKHAATTGRSH